MDCLELQYEKIHPSLFHYFTLYLLLRSKLPLPLGKIRFCRTPPYLLRCQMLCHNQYKTTTGLDRSLIKNIMCMLLSFGPESTSDVRPECIQKGHGSRLLAPLPPGRRRFQLLPRFMYGIITATHLYPK